MGTAALRIAAAGLALAALSLAALVGRDHYLLGSALRGGRWFLLLGCLLSLWPARAAGWTRASRALALVAALLLADGVVERLRRATPAAAGDAELTVMTFNLFFKNKAPKINIAAILEREPDVLLVQELTPAWEKSLNAPLRRLYPHRALVALEGTHGCGIYARFPLRSPEVYRNAAGLPYAHSAVLAHPGGDVLVINTHLASPAKAVEDPSNFFAHFRESYDLRAEQIAALLPLLSAAETPGILGGDVNTLEVEPLYARLRRDLVDSYGYAGRGLGLNFPNSSNFPRPFVRLDYILATPDFRPLEAEVIRQSSSDHLPVWAKLSF